MYSDSLDLLGSARYGHIAFAIQAIPVLRPASHLIDDGDLIVRIQRDGFAADHDNVLIQRGELPYGHPGWLSTVTGTVASYVAETPDQSGSVVATGTAFCIGDPAETAWYDGRLPGRAGRSGREDQLIRVYLETITAYRRVAHPDVSRAEVG
jgi:hypothetical protein